MSVSSIMASLRRIPVWFGCGQRTKGSFARCFFFGRGSDGADFAADAGDWLPPEREFGALADGLGDVERVYGQFLQALPGQGIELDVGLLDVGDEFRVPDHGVERLAQGFCAVPGKAGRPEHGAADRAAAGVEFVDLLVLG